MSPLALVVRHVVTPGHEAAFDALVAAVLDEIRAHEPDTLVYVSHVVEGEPSIRIFYEMYGDEAAFDSHRRQEHVRAFLAAREEHIDGVTVERLVPLDGRAANYDVTEPGRS